jgi:hypothetical protein
VAAVFIAALVNLQLPRGVPAAIAIAGLMIAGITTVEAVPSSLRTRHRRLARGLVAVCRCERPHPGAGPYAVAEPKFLLPVVVLPEPLLGRTVMAKLINELLLLTCMGGFIASATYAVTLLH